MLLLCVTKRLEKIEATNNVGEMNNYKAKAIETSLLNNSDSKYWNPSLIKKDIQNTFIQYAVNVTDTS